MVKASIIGLGAMGQGMARNILSAGIALTGFDLYAPARASFAEAGGIPAESAAEAAAGQDLALVMVATADQAEAALFDNGAADALAPGAVVVLSSTVAPESARMIAARLVEMGHMMLDAPVSGGQVGADAGTLTVMASGPDAAFERAAPLLEAVSKTVYRLGAEPGLGATYKVVHQLAAGVHLVAAAELMALGVKAGCDAQTLYQIVSGAAGNSWMFGDRAPRMMQAEPEVTSTIDIFRKDVGLVLETGQAAGVDLPMTEAAFAVLEQAGAMGLGRNDDSAVVRVYEKQTGKPVHDK
ncbi:NAD(P)-dependent oxidoreductase [Actibacterium pelagium]|uniref:6-phosphogluconate dehydrogenase n=1 Tax=Actibacterium pelagium TaxID=2029103 RepID=A0A917ELE4_9RHOB|nr:NAD(P)-dependent oxidoreductase [Actibacterium pelagium]GGE58371.1 6-phosphogluconate dehydrogenase [Actibacterium pelagium]